MGLCGAVEEPLCRLLWGGRRASPLARLAAGRAGSFAPCALPRGAEQAKRPSA